MHASSTLVVHAFAAARLCVHRQGGHVQLRAELQGSVPRPAAQAPAATAGLQAGLQGLPGLSSAPGGRWGLSAAPTAQPGPCGDLWRRHRRDIRGLPPGQTGLDRCRAAGAGQVSQGGMGMEVSQRLLNPQNRSSF